RNVSTAPRQDEEPMIRKLAAGIFHGNKLDSHEIAGFRLSEWTYTPALQFPKHSHERAFFNIVIEGAYSEIQGSEARTYGPRTLVFHPAGEVHSNYIHEAVTRIFDLEIEPRRLRRAREHGRIVDGPAEFSGGPAVWLARRLYNEFHRMDDVS